MARQRRGGATGSERERGWPRRSRVGRVISTFIVPGGLGGRQRKREAGRITTRRWAAVQIFELLSYKNDRKSVSQFLFHFLMEFSYSNTPQLRPVVDGGTPPGYLAVSAPTKLSASFPSWRGRLCHSSKLIYHGLQVPLHHFCPQRYLFCRPVWSLRAARQLPG